MYDKQQIVDILRRVEESIEDIIGWTNSITSADDFALHPDGMILLNAVCMKLLAVGEEVKSLDRKTEGKLLSDYPEISWREVMGLRDIIAHHYFDVDACEIFTVLRADIPLLLRIVRKIINAVARR